MVMFPASLAGIVEPRLGLDPAQAPGTELGDSVLLAQDETHYAVASAALRRDGLRIGDAINLALLEVHREVVGGFRPGSVVLHAAALTRNGRTILIPGASRTGKSTLAAWLMGRDYGYLSDDISALSADGGVEALYRPVAVRPDVLALVQTFGWVKSWMQLADKRLLIHSPPRLPAPAEPPRCGLILLPSFAAGEPPRGERVGPAGVAGKLFGGHYSAPELADHGLAAALAFARSAPALQLHYGDIKQLAPLLPYLDRLLEGNLDDYGLASLLAEANAAMAAAVAPNPPSVMVATPRRGPVKLTVGMATYDDFDGVYFTIQSLRLHHPEVLDEIEIVVIDNHPSGRAAPLLKQFEKDIPNYRYVPFDDRGGSAVSKQRIFDEADGRYVLGLDCHVLLAPGALRRLLGYYDAHPDSADLLQGPMLFDNLRELATHWDHRWHGGMWGVWATDQRALDVDAPPFDIPMQGLGLFACRRDAWVGFHPAFDGFGGEEGYIHEKVRQAGHRTLCVPFLRWAHRFGRPDGAPYANRWEDRIRNYLIGFRELGLPATDMLAHFRELLGEAGYRSAMHSVAARLDFPIDEGDPAARERPRAATAP
jgi:hypothetical protein